MRCASRAREGRSVALGVWALALAQYAVASAALAAGVSAGWTPVLYRVYYLFGAVLNVVWLALGTVWLLAPRLLAGACTAVAAAVSVVATVVVLSADVRGRALGGTLPAGVAVLGSGPSLLGQWLSIGGSVVVLGGIAWSALRRRRDLRGLVLIGAGVLVVAVASRAARAGAVGLFAAGLAAGVSLMYAGFVSAPRQDKPV